MSWSDQILSTPESIAKIEKEINTICTPAVEKILYNTDIATAETESVLVRERRGFGVLEIQTTDIDGTATIEINESDDDETFTSAGIVITISNDNLMEFILPKTIKDYIKLDISSTASGIMNITVKSAWADKHEIAKKQITNLLKTYIDADDLDDLDNPEELGLCADYLVLFLIYSDLLVGFGENSIYKGKMQHYYGEYKRMIESSIRRLLKDSEKLTTYERVLSR